MSKRIVPVILPGGSGAQLWPLSAHDSPKHLVALTGEHSLLQETALYVRDPGLFGAPVIVASADHADEMEAQLDAVGIAPAQIIIEPEPRGSAAAVAVAALTLAPTDTLLVMPSDQIVAEPDALRAAIERALAPARGGTLVAFNAQGDGSAFLFTADTYLDALEQHAPETLAAARASIVAQRAEGARVWPDARGYGRAPALSIEEAVMESDQRTNVSVETRWSNVDGWDAAYAVSGTDAAGNALAGDVVAIDSRDCLIRSDGPTVITIGAQQLIVVATEHGVLVAPRGESHRVDEAFALRRRSE